MVLLTRLRAKESCGLLCGGYVKSAPSLNQRSGGYIDKTRLQRSINCSQKDTAAGMCGVGYVELAWEGQVRVKDALE